MQCSWVQLLLVEVTSLLKLVLALRGVLVVTTIANMHEATKPRHIDCHSRHKHDENPYVALYIERSELPV